jgi:hypothetical protein
VIPTDPQKGGQPGPYQPIAVAVQPPPRYQ